MPRKRAFVQETGRSREKCRFRLCHLACARPAAHTELPGAREEYPGVKFDRSLAETVPIYQTRAIAEVEHVAGVKRAVQQARRTLLRLCPCQHPGKQGGEVSQRGFCPDQRGNPVPRLTQNVCRPQWPS